MNGHGHSAEDGYAHGWEPQSWRCCCHSYTEREEKGFFLPSTLQCPTMTALMEFGWKLAVKDTCGGQHPMLSEQGKGQSNPAKN